MKIATIAFAVVLVSGLVGCGDNSSVPPKSSSGASSSAAAAEKDAGPFKVSLKTVPADPKAGTTAFEIAVTRDGKPVSDATVSLTLSMPAMPGMKASEVALAGGANGIYKGSGNLSMAGEWDAKVSVKSSADEGSVSFKTNAAP